MENPYVGPVADLVDPYFTLEVKKVGGFSPTSPGGAYAIWWMRQHPGRWALVGEDLTGLSRQLLKVCPDIEVREFNRNRDKPDGVRIYARLPHPQGESLHKALARRPMPTAALYLPEVTKDEFNWTKAELDEACKIARDNLFPVGGD